MKKTALLALAAVVTSVVVMSFTGTSLTKGGKQAKHTQMSLAELKEKSAPFDIFFSKTATQIEANAAFVQQTYPAIFPEARNLENSATILAGGENGGGGGNCCPRYRVCCPQPPSKSSDSDFNLSEMRDFAVFINAPEEGCTVNFMMISEDGQILANAAENGTIVYDAIGKSYYCSMGDALVQNYSGVAHCLLSVRKGNNLYYSGSYSIKV